MTYNLVAIQSILPYIVTNQLNYSTAYDITDADCIDRDISQKFWALNSLLPSFLTSDAVHTDC